MEAFDPFRQQASVPAGLSFSSGSEPGRDSNEPKPFWSWLITGGLVLAGVTLGGLVAGMLIPQHPPVVARSEDDAIAKPAVTASAGKKGNPAAAAKQAAAKDSSVAATSAPPGKVANAPVAQPNPTSATGAETPTAQAAPAGVQVAQARAKPPTGKKRVPAKKPPVAQPQPEGDDASGSGNPPVENPAAAKPGADKPPVAEDATKRATFSKSLTATRLALSKRDLATARKQLKTAQDNGQTEADRTEFDRVQIMVDNLTEFWGGVRGAVGRMQPTEEIDLGDNRVAVISASQDELIVQMYGRPQRYTTNALPLPLLRAIVDQAFAQTPGSKVVVGTFLAMDGEGGDRAQARKLWEQAAKEGQDLGKLLLPELDIPLPGGAGAGKANVGAGVTPARPGAKTPPRRRP